MTLLPGQTAVTASQADLDVLNYALTLEYLEASFYTQFLGRRLRGDGGPDRRGAG